MAKQSLSDFERFCASADEMLMLCTKAKLLRERHIADRMLECVDRRLVDLEFKQIIKEGDLC